MPSLTMKPSRDEFHALAAEHTVVPVWTELLADLETPVAAFLKLVGDGDGFLLESVEHGERWSRYSFVGHDPVATLELRDGLITKTGQHLSADIPYDQGMLALVRCLIKFERWDEILKPGAIPWRETATDKANRALAETLANIGTGNLVEARFRLADLRRAIKDQKEADKA